MSNLISSILLNTTEKQNYNLRHWLTALSMADNGKTVRKIRQGKVDIDYEESTLVIHYDLELVSIFHDVLPLHSASMTMLSGSWNIFECPEKIQDDAALIYAVLPEQLVVLSIRLLALQIHHRISSLCSAPITVPFEKLYQRTHLYLGLNTLLIRLSTYSFKRGLWLM